MPSVVSLLLFRLSSFGNSKDFVSWKKNGCAKKRKSAFVERKKLRG